MLRAAQEGAEQSARALIAQYEAEEAEGSAMENLLHRLNATVPSPASAAAPSPQEQAPPPITSEEQEQIQQLASELDSQLDIAEEAIESIEAAMDQHEETQTQDPIIQNRNINLYQYANGILQRFTNHIENTIQSAPARDIHIIFNENEDVFSTDEQPAPEPVNFTIPNHILQGYLSSVLQRKEYCPITMEELTKQTICCPPCGHPMNHAAALEWIRVKQQCAVCRSYCTSTSLTRFEETT
jgi:hypothetical protein